MRHVVIVSVVSYVSIMGLLFTLGILAQVGACAKEMENTQKKLVDVLPLGHHLRGSAMSSTLSWRPNPRQV